MPLNTSASESVHSTIPYRPVWMACLLAVTLSSGSLFAASFGLPDSHQDIGTVKLRGDLKISDDGKRYEVTGGGANLWSTEDAFHFAWKLIRGDATLSAEIGFPEAGGDPHRKACLMVRQNLNSDSAYADAVVHGDGLASLQYRPAHRERTYEIQANVKSPKRVRIEKRGAYVSMSIAGENGVWKPAGGSFRLDLKEPYFIGLGVCAHNNEKLEKALFTQVELHQGKSLQKYRMGRPAVASTLEIVSIASKDRRALWTTINPMEAPHWTRDGTAILFNSGGRIHRMPAAGGEPTPIHTGFAVHCNRYHGISPDGTLLAISDESQKDRKSRIYLVPLEGGTPRLLTQMAPSYWHGWSPDGRTIVYGGERRGEWDVYSIALEGGSESRLTRSRGRDDGPNYSQDGKWIYFHSDRSGMMQIWRMHPDGSDAEQVTRDEYNNWFPQPSPDGKWFVFLSYDHQVKSYAQYKDVTIRIMSLDHGKIEVLAKLLGGQGTMPVPSWSPDSRKVAFMSYQWVNDDR